MIYDIRDARARAHTHTHTYIEREKESDKNSRRTNMRKIIKLKGFICVRRELIIGVDDRKEALRG